MTAAIAHPASATHEGPLVEILDQQSAPLLTRAYFASGDPGPIAATLAHVPELMASVLPMIGAVLSPAGLDWRTKEIAIVRTSALLSCRYCVDSHTGVALDAGLSHSEVRALRGEAEISDGFESARDLALIQWIDAVAGGRGPVDADASRIARSQLTDAEIVELTLLVGTTMLLNRYATALGLPVGESTIERLAKEGF